MTLEERSQLNRFLNLLTQAQAGPKDAEAEALISEAVRRQPDAAYLLVQRVLQLEHALQEATQRPSFVGDANAWGRGAAPSTSQAAPQSISGFGSSRVQPAPQAAPQAPAAAQPSAWGSGLMGTVASTAVGVVAGSMLAQGIGSLFGGHHNAANPANAATDNTVIPPGGGTVVDTDYGASSGLDSGDSPVADNFDVDSDTGDVT
jgi:hypothetical protein